jgi:phosphatidylserine/phosphatidylglycerophosphate/cardiolipin synthase-like enzyme
MKTLVISIALFAALALPAHAAPLAEVHAAPEESLDRIDADLIATAKTSIDLASYVLSDRIVIDALDAAAKRGVAIRIVLDPRERYDFVDLGDLSDTVRVKRGGPLMHLKAYETDGAVLRTGSANFADSGENAQDNDLVVLRDPAAAAKFEAHFETMWGAAQPMVEFGPAINAMEPKRPPAIRSFSPGQRRSTCYFARGSGSTAPRL